MTDPAFERKVARAKRLIEEGRHDEHVSAVVAAAVLEVSRACVYGWVRDGFLKAHRPGRTQRPRIRIPCDELHRFMHGQRLGGPSRIIR